LNFCAQKVDELLVVIFEDLHHRLRYYVVLRFSRRLGFDWMRPVVLARTDQARNLKCHNFLSMFYLGARNRSLSLKAVAAQYSKFYPVPHAHVYTPEFSSVESPNQRFDTVHSIIQKSIIEDIAMLNTLKSIT